MTDVCKRGHEFTPENTLIQKPSMRRTCRVCRQASRKGYDPVKKRAAATRCHRARVADGRQAAYRASVREEYNRKHAEYMRQRRVAGLDCYETEESRRTRNNVRRARLLAVEYDKTLSWHTLWDEGHRFCGLCDQPVSHDEKGKWRPSLDHVIALAEGGTHTRDNAQLAHLCCNSRKGAKRIMELARV